MTTITNKMTKAQLITMVEQLLGEKAVLQHENQEMKKKLEMKNAPPTAKTKDPLVRLEEEKQPVARKWLGEKLGVAVTGVIYANKTRTNFGIVLPEKEARNAKLANLVRAARAAGYASNYWGSEGMWLAPMKEQEE